MLIDKHGQIISQGSGELRRLYGAPISSSALPDFLVRNAGFIEIGLSHESVVIRAAPSRVDLTSYSSLVRLISQGNYRRASLSWFDGQWNHEFFRDGTIAVQRLMALMLRGDLADRKQFRAQGRAIESLHKQDPLGDIIALWCDTPGELDLASAREVLNNKVDAKYSVVARDPTSGTLKFQEFGPGLLIYSGRGNMSVCLGKAVQDQPDYQYGRWIAEGYRDAVLANEPIVTDMDVIVGDPLTGEERRLQYRRLTLPVQTADGSTALLSAVRVDPSIDLRFEIHHEVE